MRKKSYYLPNGHYFDITRNKEVVVKRRCEICGSEYLITQHHYLPQEKCLRDIVSRRVRYPSTWTQEFINENQKIFCLCLQCHTDVHNMSDERFFEKYGIDRKKYIYYEM